MAFERLNRVGLAHFRECAICRREEDRPHRLHHEADDGMHSLSPRLWRGGRSEEYYRDLALYRHGGTTLTCHIAAEADPITETTITLSMINTRNHPLQT